MSDASELQLALQEFPEQMAFWQQRQTAWAEPTVLVRDHLRDNTGGRSVATVPIPDSLAATTHAPASDGPLPIRVLGSAVLVLLAARATDRESVTIFLSVPDDTRPDRDRIVPLSATMAEGATGSDLLRAVDTDLREVLTRLDIPLHALLDAEGIQPTDLMLSIAGDQTAEDADSRGCPLFFDLHLGTSTSARVDLYYETRLFSQATAQRLAESFVELVGLLLKDPTQPVASLLAASSSEQALITRSFNATAADFPADHTLHRFLEEQAAAVPNAVAVADNGMTYGQLNAASNRLARVLRARGIGPGNVIGICVPRSPSMLVAVYAVLKAGGAYLPVDPTLPTNRIEYILDHSGTSVVVVTDETAHVPVGCQLINVADPEIEAADAADLPAASGPEDLAYVIYTSGSTGRPKGVMVEHRAIVNRLCWIQRAYPLTPDDVILQKTPFTFDVSVQEIFLWSLAGASVVTLPNGDEKDPQRIAQRIAEFGVTMVHFVPSMLHAVLQFFMLTNETADLSSVRRMYASGEALAVSHVEAFTRRFGPSVELLNLYGPTEAAVDVTYQPCTGLDSTKSIPIGRPIDNIRLYIRTKSGDMAPIGTPGELCIAGTGLARGYLNAPELTDAVFVPNCFEADGRMYRTGDLARWLDDGTIEYLGRIDSQVKVHGYRIELGEIEHLAVACPGVSDCAATTVAKGVGSLALVVYVVPDSNYSEARLREVLAADLPAYMLPRYIVEVDVIPTNHNGKRDLKSLPTPTARNAAPRKPS
ncbi:amino acid adenylation domain-containing protein [Streptomyces sp. NPDC056224]|uniref:non-ribosomal peptide synthetase n=1 Tax=Streptomyces sp. NPDC056224 TaxID=3345750 RepID=UPI0035E24724